MKKLLREKLNEDLEENENQGPFIDDDGWDQEALEDIGLLEWFEYSERIAYEIRGGRRGSYGIRGETAEDLIVELDELNSSLENVIDLIKEAI